MKKRGLSWMGFFALFGLLVCSPWSGRTLEGNPSAVVFPTDDEASRQSATNTPAILPSNGQPSGGVLPGIGETGAIGTAVPGTGPTTSAPVGPNPDSGAGASSPIGTVMGTLLDQDKLGETLKGVSEELLITAMKKRLQELGITAVDGKVRWSSAELRKVLELMLELPPEFRKFTKKLVREKKSGDTYGEVDDTTPDTIVIYDLAAKTIDKKSKVPATNTVLKTTLVHEMAHCVQFAQQSQSDFFLKEYTKKFWPEWPLKPMDSVPKGGKGSKYQPSTNPVTEYGTTEPCEDFAEAACWYWRNADLMKSKHPQRFEFIDKWFKSLGMSKPLPSVSDEYKNDAAAGGKILNSDYLSQGEQKSSK